MISDLLEKIKKEYKDDDLALEGILNLVYGAMLAGSTSKLFDHCMPFAIEQAKSLRDSIRQPDVLDG